MQPMGTFSVLIFTANSVSNFTHEKKLADKNRYFKKRKIKTVILF